MFYGLVIFLMMVVVLLGVAIQLYREHSDDKAQIAITMVHGRMDFEIDDIVRVGDVEMRVVKVERDYIIVEQA